MANGSADFGNVLTALSTLQSNVERENKSQAHEYLETFQKSPQAWATTFSILQSTDASTEAKLFAATTLKGKITYDLHQLPRDSLTSLRQTLLSLLKTYGAGPKPIRTQLCVCLANLAIQMLEWKDVLQLVISTLGTDAQGIACILQFLHVLPEEVIDGRKISLSEDELSTRTGELLQDNAEQVVQLLIQYARSSRESYVTSFMALTNPPKASAAQDPQLLECITSWLREVPMNDIVNSPLLDAITNALSSEASFDSAVECLSAIFKETREVDEYLGTIQTLMPRLMAIRPKIAEAAEEDPETLRGITRIFAEAGEAWVVLISRLPDQFRPLVEAILECAIRDQNKDAISLTFNFWFELKQYLVLDMYMESRAKLADVFSNLVDIMIVHLQFPKPESGNEKDLFEGERDLEEKFREFRHQMGDVLKDCCEVIGVTECLRKTYELIQSWVQKNASQSSDGRIQNWQELEAPLFSLRAMGRMVPPDEDIMLKQLIPLIIQIPNQEKVRFQAIMALGRYTEWTSQHPDTLQEQLNFIMAAFNHSSDEVIRAAALSFRFFCNDCAQLLKDYVGQLQQFYESVLDRLPSASQEEVTEGIASVVAKQEPEKVYSVFKATCDPVMKSLMVMSEKATDDPSKLAIADKLQLVTIFLQWVQPYIEPSQPNPAVEYCKEIFPVLSKIAEVFSTFIPIVERVCRSWRYMVLSYRSAIAPLLPQLAEKLAAGFQASRQGCFLWATDSIVREFSEGAENVDEATTNAIFGFFEQQATTFLRALNDLPPGELPDVIEDFFRLTIDVLLYFPHKTVASSLIKPIFSASTSSLTLEQQEPLQATLHFLRDLLAYGGEDSPSSQFDSFSNSQSNTNPPEIQAAVKTLLSEEGEILTQRIMTGMMYSFPRDCIPDASGVMLASFQLLPSQTSQWLRSTISLLPQGSITPQESQRLMASIDERVQAGDTRKMRAILQDFTNSYRRRNVAPRDGLGRLEATRFRFNR